MGAPRSARQRAAARSPTPRVNRAILTQGGRRRDNPPFGAYHRALLL